MIKTGLTASVIVSQWTWAATLLQSSNVAWQYGVSGHFWYVFLDEVNVFVSDDLPCFFSEFAFGLI
jgi:Na+/proline symporter